VGGGFEGEVGHDGLVSCRAVKRRRREDCVRLCEAPEKRDAEEEIEEERAILFLYIDCVHDTPQEVPRCLLFSFPSCQQLACGPNSSWAEVR
jgi:hypothetical protein